MAASMPLGHALAVRVEEGRHFPRDGGAAFRVSGVFDDEPRTTSFARAGGSPWWGATLSWEVTPERLRRVSATGTGQLKLTVLDAEGARFGWLVLDLRAAKLNAAPGASAQWLPLVTTWRGAKGAPPPELRVHHALFELRDVAEDAERKEAELASAVAAAAAAAAAAAHRTALRAAAEAEAEAEAADAAHERASLHSDGDDHSGDAADVASPHAPRPRASQASDRSAHDDVAPAAPAATSAPPSPSLPSLLDGSAVRVFRLTLRLAAFRPARELGTPAAATQCVVVRAALPPALLSAMTSLAAASAALAEPHTQPTFRRFAAPVRSSPPVGVVLGGGGGGGEAALPRGGCGWRFAARLGDLAAALAGGPRVDLTVLTWHAGTEGVLGVASAPLAPLLQRPSAEGYYPALAPAADVAGGPPGQRRRVGDVRLLLALEELGPLPRQQAPQRLLFRERDGDDSDDDADDVADADDDVAVRTPARPKRGRDDAAAAAAAAAEEQSDDDAADEHADVAAPPRSSAAAAAPAAAAALEATVEAAVRCAPEYAAAYDLELWRAAEQAAWARRLDAATSAAGEALAAEWARAEAARAEAAAAAAASSAALEARLRRALAAVEAREKALAAAAEAAAAARDAEKRQLAGRLADAQAAVRALREETAHGAALERGRTAEARRAAAAAEARAAAAEARAAQLATELDAFRAAARATPEGRAAADAEQARRQRDDALAAAAAAAAGRERALAAVRRIAAQLAEVMSLRDAEGAAAAAAARRATDARAAAAAAEAAGAAAAADRAAAEALRDELADMRREAAAGPPQPLPPLARARREQHHGRSHAAPGDAAALASYDSDYDVADAYGSYDGGADRADAATSPLGDAADADAAEAAPPAPEVAAALVLVSGTYGDAHGSATAAVAAALAGGADPDAEAAQLLRARATLLAPGGGYTRQHALLRRCEACIEELWRVAEERAALAAVQPMQ